MRVLRIKTLYGQLLFWGVVIIGTLGVLVYHFEVYSYRANDGYLQRVYWNRAAVFAAELAPALSETVDQARLREILTRLQKENPLSDFYVLNDDGEILAH